MIGLRLLRRILFSAAVLCAAPFPLPLASAQNPDDVHWSGAFGRPGLAGGRAGVLCSNGGSLYAGGYVFDGAGLSRSGVASYDGAAWTPIGQMYMTGEWREGTIECLLGWRGALVAGGIFVGVDAVRANHVAIWDGAAWRDLGGGVSRGGSAASAGVQALVGFEGGLVAAGVFDNAGGVAARNIARWDGTAWSPLGDGLPVSIDALGVWNGRLYASGYFGTWPDVQTTACWDGSEWSWLPNASDPFRRPTSFLARDDRLLACFAYTDTIFAWDGVEWSPHCVVPNARSGVSALADDGLGLVAAVTSHSDSGSTYRVSRQEGEAWQQMGQPFDQPVEFLTRHEGDWIAGGRFAMAGDHWVAGIAAWSGSEWRAIPAAAGITREVHTITAHEGLVLAAGAGLGTWGEFNASVLSWTGASWDSFGGILSGQHRAFHRWNAETLLGGRFRLGNDETAIARWAGSSWEPFGTGLDSAAVHTFAIWRGSLVAAGELDRIGGIDAHGIARWDGAAWHSVGSGVSAGVWWATAVSALAVLEGDLIAAGNFNFAGGRVAQNIARWDGTSWHPMGEGMFGRVYALAVRDGELYAAGDFSWAGTHICNGVARWDGSDWQPLGSGIEGQSSAARALAVFRGDLVAGGRFETAGGIEASNIARWDGSAWHPMGSGIAGRSVYCLEVCDGDLWVGGDFNHAGGRSSYNIARWSESVTSHAVLHAVYPNPVRDRIAFRYELPRAGRVRLRLFDVHGRKIATLFDGDRSDGAHTFSLEDDGRFGQLIPAGVYFLQLEANGETSSQKIIRLK